MRVSVTTRGACVGRHRAVAHGRGVRIACVRRFAPGSSTTFTFGPLAPVPSTSATFAPVPRPFATFAPNLPHIRHVRPFLPRLRSSA